MLGLGALSGCAALGGVEGQAYEVGSKGYRVVPPPGWERVNSNADLALRHAGLGAGLMAHATCGGKAPRRPLSVLARHLRFGLRRVSALEQTPVTVAGQRGIRSRFSARMDGIPVAVQALTLQGRRCVYDLVVVAPPDQLGTVTGEFEQFTGSFSLMERKP